MTKNIKKLLKLPIRTNSERMKLALGIPDLCTYLISRLLKLKIKYENIFHVELNIYNNIIEKTIGNIKGDVLYTVFHVVLDFTLSWILAKIHDNVIWKK